MARQTHKLPLRKLSTIGNDHLAYYHRAAHPNNAHLPQILLVSGYNSTIETGLKSNNLAQLCEKHGLAYMVYDHFGHGSSSGKLIDGTVTRWKNDLLRVLDSVYCKGKPQLLVGSSLGCWISLLAAKERPDQIVGLVGVGGAANFTESVYKKIPSDLIENARRGDGVIWLPSKYDPKGYPYSLKLLEDGHENLVTKPWPVKVPVTLIHGVMDDAIPYQTSINVAGDIESEDVKVVLVKDGLHEMSRPKDLQLLGETVLEMLAKISPFAKL
ncbi:hypothetical protein SmJEL517_g05373 [Synchytrium microbalum]|uniref:Serine aminopeptidase S33 domain-containing protein n=1 Tax=Synchytrium microbalum TaxID=1806994 RepID=A0A507BVU4_9FUNG|nr:uncharacterized protein SmJEL517_g05373 [Synchytrium microbalum]TPX31261.1 hypothetical protein SmJEL517_g05373 [Synchytrium microbalum]